MQREREGTRLLPLGSAVRQFVSAFVEPIPGVTADPLLMSRVSQAIATVGAPTISGAVTDDPDGTQRTVTLAFDRAGRIVDRYVKVKLVPFGEYVPGASWMPFLARWRTTLWWCCGSGASRAGRCTQDSRA